MGLKFSNFGKAIVASAPSGTTGLSFTVEAGKGLLFPTLAAGDYFYGIFKDASGNREVVKVDVRSTDSMTIATGSRGLDGTTARTWAAGDYFVAGITNVALEESLSNTNLIALGALISAADKLPYFTGSGAAALADLSAFARTFLDDSDAATVRTTLGALASSAVSAFGLTLIDDADAATARSTLGLGTMATQAASAVAITGGSVAGITDLAIADGGTGSSTASGARAALGLAYGPVFSAYNSAGQSLSTGVAAKITLDGEDFDTNSNFASSRFTPTVAGYYQIDWMVNITANPLTIGYSALYKNGSEYTRGGQLSIASGATCTTFAATGSVVVYMDGATDYVELYGFATGTTLSAAASKLSGFLARSAG